MADLSQYRRQSKATGMLDMAGRYVGIGAFEAAARTYRQVIHDFPKTPWAQQARQKLTEMGQDELYAVRRRLKPARPKVEI